jgi:hypothetical protein
MKLQTDHGLPEYTDKCLSVCLVFVAAVNACFVDIYLANNMILTSSLHTVLNFTTRIEHCQC